jgi:hypothetical protein
MNKIILTLLFIFISFSTVAAELKGRVKIKTGHTDYGQGVLITLFGKSAKALFNSLDFKDIQRGISKKETLLRTRTTDIEIRQTEYVQCQKNDKKVKCTLYILQDGMAGKLPPLYLQ